MASAKKKKSHTWISGSLPPSLNEKCFVPHDEKASGSSLEWMDGWINGWMDCCCTCTVLRVPNAPSAQGISAVAVLLPSRSLGVTAHVWRKLKLYCWIKPVLGCCCSYLGSGRRGTSCYKQQVLSYLSTFYLSPENPFSSWLHVCEICLRSFSSQGVPSIHPASSTAALLKAMEDIK